MTDIITGNDLRDYLLDCMDQADDRTSKGNRSLTKMQCWNIFIKSASDIGDGKCPEILINNVKKEFIVFGKMGFPSVDLYEELPF